MKGESLLAPLALADRLAASQGAVCCAANEMAAVIAKWLFGPGSGGGSANIAFFPRISQLIGLNPVVGAELREGRPHECYTPPPLFSAQPFSVGRFHLWNPPATRDSGPFCVCHQPVARPPPRARFAPVPPYLLSKPAPTGSKWHTQTALFINHLRAC